MTEKCTEDKCKEIKDVEDINTHKKSKLMLEAKARLYDKLKKSKNNNENFLVDFTSKSDESGDEPPDETVLSDTLGDSDDDDWIEYVDCFGRTRKCLREDFSVMQEKDELLKEQITNKRDKNTDKDDIVDEQPILPEKEPEIELMRRKWEEQTEKLADKANIHYQDVLFDEARAHGVGYYAFSQDEEQRTKQQENLAKLRKETEQKQKEMQELKELRMKMEQNRLKAARIRQRIRAGLPAEPTPEELGDEPVKEEQTDSEVNVVKEQTSNSTSIEEKTQDNNTERLNDQPEETIAATEDKIKALSELLEKKKRWHKMSQEEWVDQRRKIRVSEFGPVYGNFKSAGYLRPECSKNEVETNDKCDPKPMNNEDNFEDSDDSITPEQPQVLKSCHEQTSDYSQFDSTQGNIESTVSCEDASSNGNINEENILAGLKYLREKFEENQNP